MGVVMTMIRNLDLIKGRGFRLLNIADSQSSLPIFSEIETQLKGCDALVFHRGVVYHADADDCDLRSISIPEDKITFLNQLQNEYFPEGISGCTLIKIEHHKPIASLLGLPPIAETVSQGFGAAFTAESTPLCVTSGLSNCSVLIVVNQETKDYFFAHIGPRGFDFDPYFFAGAAAEFISNQGSISDCVGLAVLGENSCKGWSDSVKNQLQMSGLTFLEDIKCSRPNNRHHLAVLYNALTGSVVSQYSDQEEPIELSESIPLAEHTPSSYFSMR